MPRDSNGNYTLPGGNPVITGTTIESAWANTTMDDIKQGLTDSLDRYGRGSMLAPFRFIDGTQAQPGISWGSEISTGFYRAGAADQRAVVAGVSRMRWTGVGTEVWDPTANTGAGGWSALANASGLNFAQLNVINVFTNNQIIGGPTYSPVATSRYLGVSAATGRVASGVQSLSASLNRTELFADDTPAVGIDWTYASALTKFEFRRAGVEVFNYTTDRVRIVSGNYLQMFDSTNAVGATLQKLLTSLQIVDPEQISLTIGATTGLYLTSTNLNLMSGRPLRFYATNNSDFGYMYRTSGGLGVYDAALITLYVDGATRFSVTPTYLECSLNTRHLANTVSLWYNAGNTAYVGVGINASSRMYMNENGTARGGIMHWEVNTLARGTIKIATVAPTSGAAGEMVLVYE